MSTKNRTNNIKVVKDAVTPETPELLAASIIAISEGVKKLTSQGLTEDGIATLIAGMRGSKVTKSEVLLVIDGLSRLKSYYIRKGAN